MVCSLCLKIDDMDKYCLNRERRKATVVSSAAVISAELNFNGKYGICVLVIKFTSGLR